MCTLFMLYLILTDKIGENKTLWFIIGAMLADTVIFVAAIGVALLRLT